MKLAFISDLHLGYAFGTELAEDSFANALQAFELALKEKPDIILLGGDIFHEKIPRQEVLGKAIELFTDINQKIKKILVVKKITKDKQAIEKRELAPAIVGIWGTHERRHTQSINPAQLLEKAGLLRLLHSESLLVEINYEKLGIHGLSGVPEDYSRDALLNWKPEPFENSHNVLLLHQNIAEIIPVETNAIKFADFPEGFDFYLLGHIHWHCEEAHPKTNAQILIPGSTIVTQLTQREAGSEKGFFILDLPPEKKLRTVTFKPIKIRPAHYFLIEVKDRRPAEIQFAIQQAAAKALSLANNQKPLVKIKVRGTLAQGFSPADVNLSQAYKDFSEKLVLNIDKSDLQTPEAAAKATLLQELKDKKFSIDQLGAELIKKNLQIPIDAQKLEQLFDFLAEEELEQAEGLL